MKISKKTTDAFNQLGKPQKSHIYVVMVYQGMSKRTLHRTLTGERDIKPIEWEMLKPVLKNYGIDNPRVDGPEPGQLRLSEPTTLLARAKEYGRRQRRKVKDYHDTKVA